MARQYPRFLLSDPHNTKSKGPFIVHLLHPRLIAKLLDSEKADVFASDYKVGKSKYYLRILEIFDEAAPIDEALLMKDMCQWFLSSEHNIIGFKVTARWQTRDKDLEF